MGFAQSDVLTHINSGVKIWMAVFLTVVSQTCTSWTSVYHWRTVGISGTNKVHGEENICTCNTEFGCYAFLQYKKNRSLEVLVTIWPSNSNLVMSFINDGGSKIRIGHFFSSYTSRITWPKNPFYKNSIDIYNVDVWCKKKWSHYKQKTNKKRWQGLLGSSLISLSWHFILFFYFVLSKLDLK